MRLHLSVRQRADLRTLLEDLDADIAASARRIARHDDIERVRRKVTGRFSELRKALRWNPQRSA